ncbi:hypothetical protein EPA93_15360 [Ktedonosporobacter rubrisoli]|uniref:Carboxypeptidase M32 n=1 Tax=Ktedonosporobacter rubrisoli TaxID=2509675 RepID=A0A4P6JPS6_KTERU|nr:hypothetical protein [Ktedonosporobacter rubrisoli]QBD77295.1 hypothetical protein EPA93_15360 [Ktedonosporobacter rubrisoli]
MQVIEEEPIRLTCTDDRIRDLAHLLHSLSDLQAAGSLLGWDQMTGGLPEEAGEVRAHQAATLKGLILEQRTAARLGQLLDELEGVIEHSSFTNTDRGLVRWIRHDYEWATKLPRSLVEEMERASVISYQAWVRARATNDFAIFAPTPAAHDRLPARGRRSPGLPATSLRCAFRSRESWHDLQGA